MKSKILVVEDNEDILFHIKLILEFNNYQVETALSGEEALNLISEMEVLPDLILSDIIMPKMNGYDFFIEISKNRRFNNVPFIFASARATLDDIRFAKLLGADDYIKKPFQEGELLKKITEKIEKSKIIKNINRNVRSVLNKLESQSNFNESIIIEEKYYLYLMLWEKDERSIIFKSYPPKENKTTSIQMVSKEILRNFTNMKNNKKIELPETLLINLKQFDRQAFLYYDVIPDNVTYDADSDFIIVLIGPDLNYFKSLKLKKLFTDIGTEFKEKKTVDLKSRWDGVFNAISD